MNDSITIKSFPNGILVHLNSEVSFERLYADCVQKFRDSAKFFGNAKRVISFEGRELTNEEESILLSAIIENTQLNIICIMEKDDEQNQIYLRAANSFSSGKESEGGQIYKGTLHAGQNIESNESIIILGDVNPGARVASAGCIIVLGTVYGELFAGANGDESSFVAALDFKTTTVHIAEKEAKVLPKSAGFLRTKPGARIVFIKDGNAQIEEITKEFLVNIPF